MLHLPVLARLTKAVVVNSPRFKVAIYSHRIDGLGPESALAANFTPNSVFLEQGGMGGGGSIVSLWRA